MIEGTYNAIPWLHVERAHHVCLQKYEHIYDDTFIGYFKNTKRKARNVILLFIVLIQSLIYQRYSRWLKTFNHYSQTDILFISHLLNKSQYSQMDDFYFSNLPQKVSSAGFKSLTILINHTGSDFSKGNKNNLHKIVLPRRLGFYDEIKNLSLLWIEYKALKKEMRSEVNKTKKKFLKYAAIESLSHSSLLSMRLGMQVSGIIKTLGIKNLIITHEGFAWERKVFDAARQVNQNINCIGYTHAPIFEKQHAVKRNLAAQYNPDVILNSGYTQKMQFKKYGLLKNIQIEVLGSVRSTKEKLSVTRLKTNKKILSQKKQSFIVAPEGIKKEIDLLFDFSLECAEAFPEYQFIWRLHPLFSFNKLPYKKLKYRNLPDNIILSDQTLQYDLCRAQWILYRGSSVVIQAVSAGLKPIYLHRDNEIKIDPIYEIKNWKSEVLSVEEFGLIARNIKGDYSDYHKALKYCKDIYSPLNVKILIETIRKGNL